jgi:DNA invertase Pin-like site-specific DNA recombinase
MAPERPRAVLYRRVSTDEQHLGLAAQAEQLEAEAERRGWRFETVTDEDVSGSVPADKRPGLGPALASLGPGDVLAVAKLDRLSRSVLDFAGILRRAEEGGWSIVVLDLGVDMTGPSGRLIAHILAAVAEWERAMISVRIREGLAQSEKRLGRRPGLPPVGAAARGPAPVAPEVLAAVRDLREAGRSPGAIAKRLNAYGHPSPRGGRWHRESARRLLQRLESEDGRR